MQASMFHINKHQETKNFYRRSFEVQTQASFLPSPFQTCQRPKLSNNSGPSKRQLITRHSQHQLSYVGNRKCVAKKLVEFQRRRHQISLGQWQSCRCPRKLQMPKKLPTQAMKSCCLASCSRNAAKIESRSYLRTSTSFQTEVSARISLSILLPALIIEPMIKLGLRTFKVPSRAELLHQLKSCFRNSKYALSLYTNKEISDNLPRFIELQAYGLEQRLVGIKLNQKFKDYISQRDQKYLPIRSNQNDAQNDYFAFKLFSEINYFHHSSVLKNSMKRITYFGKLFLVRERIKRAAAQLHGNCSELSRLCPLTKTST